MDEKLKADARQLVADLEGYFGQYLFLKDQNVALLMALYAVMTWTFQRFYAIPYIALTGPRGSGKSTALGLLSNVSQVPYLVTGASAAPLFRKLLERDGRMTLLFDEAETTSKEGRDLMSQFMNAGYKKGQVIPKVVGGVTVDYPAFCPKAVATISDPNDALRSRCVLVRMERGDPAKEYWPETGEQEGIALAERIQKMLRVLDDPTAEYPGFLTTRDREIWGAIFGLAKIFHLDAATVKRLVRVASDNAALKQAEKRTLEDTKEDETTWRNQLYGKHALRDLARVIKEGERNIASVDAVRRMHALDDGPWRMYRGSGLDATVLADLLAHVGLGPNVVHLGVKDGKAIKASGYKVKDIQDALAGKLEPRVRAKRGRPSKRAF